MSTAITNGDYCVVRYCCYTAAQISLNICHYRFNVTAGSWTDAMAVVQIANAVHNAYKSNMPDEARFRGVGFRLLLPALPAEVSDVAQDGPGTSLGDLSPSQVSGVITKRSALAGRRYRGRMYIGFVSNLDINADGSPTLGYVGGLNAIATAVGPNIPLVDGVNTASMDMMVQSNVGVAPPNYEAVVGFTTRNRFGTQRSRGQYGAQNVPPF